jgi:hypothetical protein
VKEQAMVRMLNIHATTASMQSDIRNAYVNFREMTTSVVAVVTDVMRHGKPVVGYGFNSNGPRPPRCSTMPGTTSIRTASGRR